MLEVVDFSVLVVSTACELVETGTVTVTVE